MSLDDYSEKELKKSNTFLANRCESLIYLLSYTCSIIEENELPMNEELGRWWVNQQNTVLREKQKEAKEKENLEPIEVLRLMVEKYQWSDTAYGFADATARRCPECEGMHLSDRLNLGAGKYLQGKGHLEGCEISKALES